MYKFCSNKKKSGVQQESLPSTHMFFTYQVARADDILEP